MTKNAAAAAEKPSQSDLLALVQKCQTLCQGAERSIQKIDSEREAFLSKNLAAAVQQVELVLRVLGEQDDGHRDAERQSLLKRLFARGADTADGESAGAETSDDIRISAQGLQGNSWTVSLAELLGFLAFAHKTGVLWVDSPGENFLLGIVGGKLMHASSDHTPEGLRLGEVLVGLGFLTRRQLERFLQSRPEGESVSGEILLESGVIVDDELRQALGCQVRKLFTRLIATEQAVFRFQDGLNVQLAYQVDMDINQLLLDSARTSDEVDSPAMKAASAVQEWNSWTEGLDAKVEKIAALSEDAARSDTVSGEAGSDNAASDADSPSESSTAETSAKSDAEPAST